MDKLRPTIAWAVVTDSDLSSHHTNCLRQLPSQPGDDAKTIRFRCLTCFKYAQPGNQLDAVGRIVKANQASDVASHCAGQGHLKAHLKNYPVSTQEMCARILNTTPALRALLQEYAVWFADPKKKGKKRAPSYTSDELDVIEQGVNVVDVGHMETNVLALYSATFDFGMGSKASTRGAGARKPKANQQQQQPFRAAPVNTPVSTLPPPVEPPDHNLPTNPTLRTATRQNNPRQPDFLQQLQSRANNHAHFFNKRSTSA